MIVILNAIKGLANLHWTPTDFQMRWSNFNSSIGIKNGLLGCASNVLLNLRRTYSNDGDVKCHKKFYLPSLDTNSFSDEKVKGHILFHVFGCCIDRILKLIGY